MCSNRKFPPANEVWGKVLFSQVSIHRGGDLGLWGVSVLGGSLSCGGGGLSPKGDSVSGRSLSRGSLSRGESVRGESVQGESLSRGVYLSRGCLCPWGCLCSGGSLSRGSLSWRFLYKGGSVSGGLMGRGLCLGEPCWTESPWDSKERAVCIPLECILVTGRNEVVAKVIFLHLFVILFTGGVYLVLGRWGCLV